MMPKLLSMVKEFLLLLEIEKKKIFEVLRPQVHIDILKFLSGGFFDESQKRFVAFALMPVDKDYFWKYDYLLNFSGGHSSILFGLPAKEIRSGIYPASNKSLKEKIEEEFYHRNLVSFLGEYDFGEWNIMTSNCFSNSKNKNQIFESELYK